MKEHAASGDNAVYYRLIALWVICEAMLGGIIHGFRIPVSGLVVGSAAVICISLIAWYVPNKGAILKATVIVAIFKMMLSPQSPPPAYIAVFFQGFLGEVLFFNRKWFRVSCLLLGILALVESGLQRILVLTIVYGNDLWSAINDFIRRLTNKTGTSNYSLYIAGSYVFLHLVTGIIIGWWCSLLPKRISQWRESFAHLIKHDVNEPAISLPVKKRKRIKKGLLIAWILLVLLYLQSYFEVGKPLLSSHVSIKLFIRSLIIVLAWYFLARPIIELFLKKWLLARKARSGKEIEAVLDLLPGTRRLIIESWKLSAVKKGVRRMNYFCKLVLSNALSEKETSDIYILSGPVQTGKTTSLIIRFEKMEDAAGILTPVIKGRRMFYDIGTSEYFEMETHAGDEGALKIGKYNFSKKAFTRAVDILREGIKQNKKWLVIDEIGPLELKGEGFHDVLKEILMKRSGNTKLLIVARDTIMNEVIEYFNLRGRVENVSRET